jgi:hypothetical protein
MCRRRRHPKDDVDIIQDINSLQTFVQIYRDKKTICTLSLPQGPSVYVCVCVCVCVFEALQKNLFNVRNKVNKETTELVRSLWLQ